ncbi:hypothetical protein EBB07_05865 [Paenibacillaceae bacterium]|nr:hypothetical protein EBB07_05865 [Paenibacillaceae bacterium]
MEGRYVPMRLELPCCVKTFDEVFPTEAACQQFWEAERWQMEFCCPRCGSLRGWLLPGRGVRQCAKQRCRHQVSSTAGTILHKTRLPMRTWLRAMVYYAEQPLITVRALASILHVSVKTAGLLLRKIRLAWQQYKVEYGCEPRSGESWSDMEPQQEQVEQGLQGHQEQRDLHDHQEVQVFHDHRVQQDLRDHQEQQDLHGHHEERVLHDQQVQRDLHGHHDEQVLHDHRVQQNLHDHQEEPGFHTGQFLEEIKRYVQRQKQGISARFHAYLRTCVAMPPIQQIWEEQADRGRGWWSG